MRAKGLADRSPSRLREGLGVGQFDQSPILHTATPGPSRKRERRS
jgi:hypothetical protein